MPDKHKPKLDRIGHAVAATLGTLAARTAQSAGSFAPTQNFRPALYQGAVQARAQTEGEIVALYVAQNGLTQAQVKAAIESVPTNSRNKANLDATRAQVQYLGTISLADGLDLNVPNRLAMFRESIGAEFWVYNPSGTALTTGTLIGGQIWTYGRWED